LRHNRSRRKTGQPHRLWRDIRGHRFGGGTDEIMVHIAGRQIVKDHS
jgi:alkylation response protein AidB-like acyl-CoA dehydrogenase